MSLALPVGLELGHYRLLSKVGQGGFGITYLAEHVQSLEKVVIKENLPTFYASRNNETLRIAPLDVANAEADYAHTLRRFVDEARTLARLNHPNIVRVLDAFEALGTAYYVMPYIEAKELHKVIPTEAVNEAWLLPILKSVLGALDYLHAQNLLHRDLKPGNILLQADGTPILIDFGTARALQTERSATMVGTPGYTPLEQITPHGNRGPWTDLYALGATCYRLITGELPPQSIERIDDDPYRPLAARVELQARFSHALLSSIDKALAVRAKERWQSAQEWMLALAAPAGSGVSPHATAQPPYRMPTGQVAEVSATGSGGKGRLVLIFSLLVVILMGGGYGVYAYLEAEAQDRLRRENALAEAKRMAQERAERFQREEEARLAREEAERKVREEAERVKREEEARLAREEAEREAREEAERKARAEGACLAYIKSVLAVHADTALPETVPAPQAESVVQSLRALCERGNHDAEFVLSVLYAHGQGVPMDKEQSMQLLRNAAEGGNTYARLAMAERYATGSVLAKDEAEAVKWYRLAAEQGHAGAQAQMGHCYRHGVGVVKNHFEAAQWFRMAAEQGNAQGQNGLGACYYEGAGVAKDEVEAVKWIRRAAEQDLTAAQRSLGYCYHQGIGVAKDNAEGVRWYRRAAELGDAIGQYSLGYCYQQGIGVAKDNYEAVKWFRRAAEQGNDKAQHSLGYCYANGLGVSKDRAQAIAWYRSAARQGNKAAQSALSKMGVTW